MYRLFDEQGPNKYLKIMPLGLSESLAREAEVLRWLEGKLPVPMVMFFACDGNYEFLLMSEIPGVPACDRAFEKDLPELIRLLAQGLRMIHSIDISGCPFDQRLSVKMKEAADRTAKGLVGEQDFDDIRQGRTAEDLLAELFRTKPAAEDLVFTHGDYCLPNMIIHNGGISGFVDWGRAGIADRYQDLALTGRSLTYNFGAEWVPLLFREYGLERPDLEKVE